LKLCQDCAVFNHSNTTHQVTRLFNSDKLDLKQIISKYAALGKSLNTLNFLLSSLSKKLEKIKENYRKEKNSLQSVQDSMQETLDDLLKKRLSRLETKKNLILNEKIILEKILKTIQTEIDLSSQVQMINNSQMLLEKIREITSVPWTEEVFVEKTEKFRNPVLPSFKTLTFSIQRFLECEDCINSQILKAYLNSWQLKVYPRGNGSSSGEYVSVFLKLVDCVTDDQNFEFRIEMVHENCLLSVVKEGNLRFSRGECWGFSRFLMISQVRSGFLIKDSVTFTLSVRPSSYQQISSDQSKLITSLKNSNQLKLI
jgi:hypothetical protein